MDTTKYIKLFAFINLVLMVVYMIASNLFEPQLPSLLQDYISLEEEAEISTFQLIIYIGILLIAILHIISLIGLIFIKPWSKNIFIYTSVGFFLFLPFMGPYVDHAISAMIDSLSTLAMGVLIGLLTFANSAFNDKYDAGNTCGTKTLSNGQFFEIIKDHKTIFIFVLLVFSLVLTIYGTFLGLREFEISSALYTTWNFFFAFVIACWAKADVSSNKESWGIDWPFYVFIFWIVVMPYYLCKTRGIDGLIQYFGLITLYLCPFMGNLIAYFYFS